MSRNCLLHQTTNPDAQVAQMMLERVGGQLGVSKDDLGRFEGPQIVHYDPGGEYRWHHDAYEEGTEEGDRAVADQGQRCQTAIVYLNDVKEGGETGFKHLGIKVQPRQGAFKSPLQ
jgi:hypothetical protein